MELHESVLLGLGIISSSKQASSNKQQVTAQQLNEVQAFFRY